MLADSFHGTSFQVYQTGGMVVDVFIAPAYVLIYTFPLHLPSH